MKPGPDACIGFLSGEGGRGAGDRGGPPRRGSCEGPRAGAELGRPGATWGLAALRVPRPAPSEGGSSALILLLRLARDARGRMHLGAVISFPILLSARVVHNSKRKHEWSFKRPLPIDGGGGLASIHLLPVPSRPPPLVSPASAPRRGATAQDTTCRSATASPGHQGSLILDGFLGDLGFVKRAACRTGAGCCEAAQHSPKPFTLSRLFASHRRLRHSSFPPLLPADLQNSPSKQIWVDGNRKMGIEGN